MGVSEPGGELREALESMWGDWQENDPEHFMSFSDFLAPEVESTLRVTYRYILRKYFSSNGGLDQERTRELVDDWVKQFALVMRDKRPAWRDTTP